MAANPKPVTLAQLPQLFYDEDSEQALLGCVLHDPRTLVDARATLAPPDFYLLRHRYVFEAMLRLADAGKALDMITLGAELKRAGHFEDIGGHATLAQLAGAMVSTANVESYAAEIADRAYQRRLLEASDRLKALALEPAVPRLEREDRAETLLKAAGAQLGDEQDVSPIGDEMSDYLAAVEATEGLPAGISGTPTGFYDLDHLLDGMQPRSLNLLGGRPGMGKSAVLLAIALQVAKWGGSVYFWSGEMPKAQLRERAMATEAGIETATLRRGLRDNGMTPQEYTRFVAASGKLGRLPIWFDDTPAITPARLHARAERVARRAGGLDLIVVDYLGLMNPGVKTQSRNLDLGGITKFLKQETTHLAPVLAGSQLSRALEVRNDKRPILSDLRDSGELENDADVVMFAYRDVEYHPETQRPNELELIVRKNRHGGLGTVKLYFEGQYTRVRNSAFERGL